MNYSGNTRTVSSYGMTPLQRGMLVNVISAPDSGVETTQVVVTDPDPLDLDRLQAAWKKAIERYDMLRTRFEWDGQGEPVQIVEPEVSLWLGVGSWVDVPADEREARLEAYLEADRYTSVDVFAAPMYRLKVLDMGADGFHLIWTFHHSALDGRAYSKVIGEVFSAYDAMGDGADFVPGPAPAFRGYVDWLKSRDTSEADTYWRNLLSGFERPTPIDLPWPVALPEGKRRNGAQAIHLPVEILDRLKAFAADHEVTLYTLVQAAWALLLHHLSGDKDVVFGATRASRSSGPPDASDMVGLLINTLPMRIEIDPDRTVGDWLRDIRSQHLAHRPHEHFAMQDLQRVAQVPPGMPVFDTIVVFDSQFLGQRLQRLSDKWARRNVRRFVMPSNPLRLDGYVDGDLLLEIQYHRDRFDDETIARMCARLELILTSLAREAPARVRDIAVLPDAERRQQIEHWNATDLDVAQAAFVHDLVKARMRERPDAIALVSGKHRLTYGALEVRSNRLANHLIRQGVKPGDLVGLCVTRSVEMVVALLGILKAGAGYVPMDPAYPLERLRHMLDTANCAVLLGEDGLVEHALDRDITMVLLERDGEVIAKESETAPAVELTSDSLAYVIFTSGSTGRPKGVQVPHSAVVNFLTSMKETPSLSRDDVLLAVTTFSFDIHVLELFGPLAAGGTVVLAGREESIDGERLTALIAEHGVNVMQATPTTWRLLIEAGWQGGDGFRPLVGGEALPRDLLRSLLARVPRVWNMYGPTETTVWSTCCELSDPEAPILIGRPIGNTQLYVLDDSLKPVPGGMPGELYIGGAGVTRGYLGQPELTDERFVPDPFKACEGRLYRTGDLVRYHPEGDLEFLNRLDSQVKIRGYRIELGEIESVLTEHAGVDSAVVQVWRPDADDASLVAYYTMSSIAEPDAMELHSHLRARLPAHMVPLHIIHLNRMPLTENGKIDRKVLPAPDFEISEPSDPAALPRTELERLIGEIWSRALGCGRVSRVSNFFELGGNSLMALRVVKEIKCVTGQELPLAAFFENPTLEQVAANLGTGEDIAYSVVPLNEFGRDPGATDMPPPSLFCISGIYIYQPMARLLEETCQVYGIYVQAEVDNFEEASRGGPSEEITEALAAEYVKAIRSEKPKGPYRLAGLSYGGIIAYEAAQQLIAQGETVDLVVMFDSIIPAHGWQRLSKRLARHRRRVLREGPGYLFDKLAGRLRKRVSLEHAAMNGAVPDNQAMIDEEYDRRHARLMQLVRYQPQTFPGRIVFIQAVEFSEMRGFDASPQDGWSKFAEGGIKVFKAPGDHISIMQSESVSLWAGHLRDELKK